jgi:mono/diheme cytochrome c family protein
MSFRTILIIVNLLAIAGLVGFIIFRVVSLRRNPEPKTPDNLTPFFDDEVLEGAHLERVLGVSLIALIIVVLGLLGYFIWEPFREASAKTGFQDRSIERGAVLFANSQSKAYDSTKSLLCANCHGVDGGGGVASFVVKSEDPRCNPAQVVNPDLAAKQPYCLPKQVSWMAPNLQLAGLRYSSAQLTQIITYGRPGTPMPAWGVLSGKGALQEQSIQDLVNYVESIITTPDKAQALAAAQTPATRKDAQKSVQDHRTALATAQTALAALPASASEAERTTAQQAVTTAQANLAAAIDWNQQMQLATDGQILFQNNCARCHTRGWSYFDPNEPLTNPLPESQGSGAYGPNLTGGDVSRQFPPPTGDAELFAWISIGVEQYQGYGIRGISSGRMPHFGAVLTKSQIEQIMAYERSL